MQNNPSYLTVGSVGVIRKMQLVKEIILYCQTYVV